MLYGGIQALLVQVAGAMLHETLAVRSPKPVLCRPNITLAF